MKQVEIHKVVLKTEAGPDEGSKKPDLEPEAAPKDRK